MQIIAQSKRLCLRKWSDADRRPFAQMNKNLEVMKFLGPPLSRPESDAAIDQQLQLMEAGDPAFWSVERLSDNHFIGCIGVKRVTFDAAFTPCYEIGWRLAEPYWGQGYASEGAIAALKVSFERWEIPAVYSFTVPSNAASQAVMKKIGMQRVVDGDFDHPKLAKDDPLLRHVLYKIDREAMAIKKGPEVNLGPGALQGKKM